MVLFLIRLTEYFIRDETQNYDKLPRLIKIILYYEVPQNALCSLCLHCLNSGSKKPQEILSLQQRAQPPEIRCVRYRYTAVKMSQSKGFFTNPSNKRLFRLSSFFNLEIQKKRRELKLIQGF